MTLFAAALLSVAVGLVAVVSALVRARRSLSDAANARSSPTEPRARTPLLWRLFPGAKQRLDHAIAWQVAELHRLGEHAHCHPECGGADVSRLWRDSGCYFDRHGMMRLKNGQLPYANAPP